MKISYDPTINLGHIVSILSFALLGIGAYYDLKSDVRNNRTIFDQRWEQQKIIDTNQDQRLGEIKSTVQESTNQINHKLDALSQGSKRY